MFLGIDVSKSTLDVVLTGFTAAPRKSPHKVFGNNAKGHAELVTWLGKQCGLATPIHACLEATGPWGEGVALALHEAGHIVSVVNPAQIRAFGQSQLKRTNTDKAGCPLGGPN